MAEDPTTRRSPVEQWQEKVGKAIGDAATQIEHETERLVTYLNDEVVPAARQHSSEALRKASQKLAEFATYLEDKEKKKGS